MNPSGYTTSFNSHSSEMLERLYLQQCQGKFCDIMIVVDRLRFSAHKNILSAASIKFHSLILSLDHAEMELHLEEVKPQGFKVVLDYIYSGNGSLWIPPDCLEDVHEAAVYLELHEVVAFCEEYLESEGSMENKSNEDSNSSEDEPQQTNVQDTQLGSNPHTSMLKNSSKMVASNWTNENSIGPKPEQSSAKSFYSANEIDNQSRVLPFDQTFSVNNISHSLVSDYNFAPIEVCPTTDGNIMQTAQTPSTSFHTESQVNGGNTLSLQPHPDAHKTMIHQSIISSSFTNLASNQPPDNFLPMQPEMGQSVISNNVPAMYTNHYQGLRRQKYCENETVPKTGPLKQEKMHHQLSQNNFSSDKSMLSNTAPSNKNNSNQAVHYLNKQHKNMLENPDQAIVENADQAMVEHSGTFTDHRPAARMPPKKAGYRGGVVTAGDDRHPMNSTSSKSHLEGAKISCSSASSVATGSYVSDAQRNEQLMSNLPYAPANSANVHDPQNLPLKILHKIPHFDTHPQHVETSLANIVPASTQMYAYNHDTMSQNNIESLVPPGGKNYKKCVPKHQHFRQRYEATLALEEIDSDLGMYMGKESNSEDPNMVFYDMPASHDQTQVMAPFMSTQAYPGNHETDIYPSSMNISPTNYNPSRQSSFEKQLSYSGNMQNINFSKILQTPNKSTVTDYFEEYLKCLDTTGFPDALKNLPQNFNVSPTNVPSILGSNYTDPNALPATQPMHNTPPHFSTQRFGSLENIRHNAPKQHEEESLPGLVPYDQPVVYHQNLEGQSQYETNTNTIDEVSRSLFQLLKQETVSDMACNSFQPLGQVTSVEKSQDNQFHTENVDACTSQDGNRKEQNVTELAQCPQNVDVPSVTSTTGIAELPTINHSNELTQCSVGLELPTNQSISNTNATLCNTENISNGNSSGTLPSSKTKRRLSFAHQNLSQDMQGPKSNISCAVSDISQESGTPVAQDNITSRGPPDSDTVAGMLDENQVLDPSSELAMVIKKTKKSYPRFKVLRMDERRGNTAKASHMSMLTSYKESRSPIQSRNDILKPLKKRIRVNVSHPKDQPKNASLEPDVHVLKHVRKFKYACEICGRSFRNSITRLDDHMKVHHQMEQGAKDIKLVFCEDCGAGYKRPEDLTKHKMQNHSEKAFDCSNCQETFTSPKMYKKHCVDNHGQQKPFACKESGCNFQTSVYYLLNKHTLSHSSDRPISCSNCALSFNSAEGLKKHMFACLNQKQFSCELCSKRFNRKQGLSEHITAVHKKSKPFSCSQCAASFCDVRNLHRHSLIHTDKQPFSCPECQRAFRHSNAMKRHLKQVHHLGMRQETTGDMQLSTESDC